MAFSWSTAVGLIVIIAVFTVLYTESDALCLEYMLLIPMAAVWSVKYFVDLMKFQFFELWVFDTVYRIVEYICT